MRLRGFYHLFLATTLTILAGCGGGGGGSGAGNISVPASITVSSSQARSFINHPITITANVKQADGTAVADGTSVTFSASGGTGGTFTPATATTSGGIATASFNSTAAGTFSIIAAAGSVSGNLPMTIAEQATQAIVKLATSGSLPQGALIGGISGTLTYPTAKGLSIARSDVVLSGASAGGIFEANVTTPDQVIFGNLNISPSIPFGEFLTATFTIPAGNPQVVPVESDFTIAAGASVIDTNGTTLPTVSIAIQSVTIQ